LLYRWIIRLVLVIVLGMVPVYLTLIVMREYGKIIDFEYLWAGLPVGILLTWCTAFFLPFGRPVHDSLAGVTLCNLIVSRKDGGLADASQFKAELATHGLSGERSVLAEVATAGELPDQRIDQYEIVCELGRGGMGTVYSANDTTLDRKVALKLVAPHLVAARDALPRFEREAMLAAQLNHVNVARVLGIGDHQGTPWLAMDFIDGQDLDSLIKSDGPVPVRDAWDYVIQAATGLRAVNELGIIHRDIKPANLMLDETGIIKVMDFGISKRVGETDFQIENDGLMSDPDLTQDLTQFGEMIGTPMYMSPEQARSQELTTASDIYSLGLTLYTLLAGRPPFESRDTIELVSKQVSEDPDFNSGLIPELAPAQLAVLQGMVAKEVGARYQDYASLLHDLELTRRADPVVASENERFSAFLILTLPIEILRVVVLIPFELYFSDTAGITNAVTIAVYFVLYPAICILGVWRYGMHPGHWLRRLRVVSHDGGKVSLLSSSIRYLSCFPVGLSALFVMISGNILFTNSSYLVWMVSLILMHLTTSKRAIHDFAAGTKVVKEYSLVDPNQLSHQAARDQ